MLFFQLHSSNAVGKMIGKSSERKLVTSLLASWKTAGKLQNIFEVHSSLIFSENPWCFVLQQTAVTVLNLVSVCLIFQKRKTYYFEIHFKRQNIHAFVRSTDHFTKDSFKQISRQEVRWFRLSSLGDLRPEKKPRQQLSVSAKERNNTSGKLRICRSALPKRRKLKIRIWLLVTN